MTNQIEIGQRVRFFARAFYRTEAVGTVEAFDGRMVRVAWDAASLERCRPADRPCAEFRFDPSFLRLEGSEQAESMSEADVARMLRARGRQ